jgi:hypothetical protein
MAGRHVFPHPGQGGTEGTILWIFTVTSAGGNGKKPRATESPSSWKPIKVPRNTGKTANIRNIAVNLLAVIFISYITSSMIEKRLN